LSARLERCVYALMVLLAFWAVVLALSPAVAEAQGIAPTKDPQQKGTERIVVSPGDSLWSISSERLGPNATPQQIASGAERIYALNQNQIGADPNLIFPGQRLLVPPVAGATPTRDATEPTQKNPTARATERAPDRTPRPPVDKAAPKAGEAPAAGGERAHLPDMAQPAPVPAAKPLAPSDTSRSPGESLIGKARAAVSAATSMVAGLVPRDGYNGRQLLGVALLMVSSTLALILTLRLARELVNQGRAKRRAREVRENYATFVPLPRDREENGSVGNGSPAAHASNGPYPAEIFAPVRRRQRQRLRRGQLQSSARQVRRGLSHGAHSPHVRRVLRRRGMGR
jgi:hypothetical protein